MLGCTYRVIGRWACNSGMEVWDRKMSWNKERSNGYGLHVWFRRWRRGLSGVNLFKWKHVFIKNHRTGYYNFIGDGLRHLYPRCIELYPRKIYWVDPHCIYDCYMAIEMDNKCTQMCAILSNLGAFQMTAQKEIYCQDLA